VNSKSGIEMLMQINLVDSILDAKPYMNVP